MVLYCEIVVIKKIYYYYLIITIKINKIAYDPIVLVVYLYTALRDNDTVIIYCKYALFNVTDDRIEDNKYVIRQTVKR